jgi:hypothetical protein
MRGKKSPKKMTIANVPIDLTKSYEENWEAVEYKVESLYSREGIYKNLLKKSFPLKEEKDISAFSKFWVRFVAFFMSLGNSLKAQSKDKLLEHAQEKLDEYWFDTATRIQLNLEKAQAQIDKLEEESIDIEAHLFDLKDIDPQTEMHEQEIYGMSMRFEMELDLCKARLALAKKSKQQLLKIQKAYEVNQQLESSRQKLISLESKSDETLSNSIEVSAQVKVLNDYVLMIEEAQEDAEKEEDYQKVLSLEEELTKMKL